MEGGAARDFRGGGLFRERRVEGGAAETLRGRGVFPERRMETFAEAYGGDRCGNREFRLGTAAGQPGRQPLRNGSRGTGAVAVAARRPDGADRDPERPGRCERPAFGLRNRCGSRLFSRRTESHGRNGAEDGPPADRLRHRAEGRFRRWRSTARRAGAAW